MKDIIGEKINKLTVIELDRIEDHTYPSGFKSKIPYFKCLCECGNYTVVRQSELMPNKTKSCGCLVERKEVPDISGLKSGRLTAIERHERKGNYWSCICECGNESVVLAKYLKSGATKSCGCRLPEINKEKADDLSGRIYGRLMVVNRSDRGGRYWDCICSCGKDFTTLSGSLKTGATKSCGCLLKETCKENMLTYIKEYRVSKGLSPEHNLSSDNALQRADFGKISPKILARDRFSCVWCSARGVKFNVHHIVPWAMDESLRFDEKNMVTLCKGCHLKVHQSGWYKDPEPYMSILLQGYVNLAEEGFFETTPN